MSPEVLGLIMLGLLVIAIMIGFPTAFTLMALGITFGFLGIGFVVFDLVVQRTFFVMQNDVLVAIPLFLFMGYVVERAGILDELFHSVQVMFGWLPGSLAVATLATGTIFATATGIVGASVTLLGLLAFPAMMKAGYNKQYAAGAVTASGTLGILIPPSVLLILYGFVAGVSVPRLYAGAFLPGFMLSSLYLVYIIVRAKVQPSVAPMLSKELREQANAGEMVRLILRGFVPIVSLILFVLGAIFFGLATPSEGAALGALGGLLLAAIHRRLTFSMLRESVFLTVRTSAMVGWLLVGSSIFAAVFARLGGGSIIADFVIGLNLSPEQFFWMAQFLIFLLGWPLEWTEITIIFLPLFLPLLQTYHVRFPDNIATDAFFFGIMVAINQQTSFLSPPVAMSAYYLKGVVGKLITLNQIFQGMYPYLAIQVVAMLVLWLFPQLAYYFPTLVYGGGLR
ncbi:MAG TPA: TRAP transporter large permease subunit [Candidatus Limnocylindria bacterium]|nr:TRAP transporter large permease subunit [Candidatus Limnocylindria bacterium]